MKVTHFFTSLFPKGKQRAWDNASIQILIKTIESRWNQVTRYYSSKITLERITKLRDHLKLDCEDENIALFIQGLELLVEKEKEMLGLFREISNYE